MSISFFDCNCILGERRDRRDGEPSTLEELTADMKYFGIQKTLAVHGSSRDYHPAAGNSAISSIVAANQYIYGVWAILPEGTKEIPTAREFIKDLIKQRISATIAYPRLHKFSLSDWSAGNILTGLAKGKIPLIIPFSETNWDEVHSVCQRYPMLPVIITGCNYRQLRYLLQLWKFNKNLFIDISWFSIANGFEYLEKHGYIQNLLFGTNYPLYSPGAAIAMISYANISEKNKLAIAGKNLQNLLDQGGSLNNA